MSSIYKCIASLAVLTLLSCGGSEVSQDTQLTSNDDVNTKLEALISLQGDLESVVQSEYVACSTYGDTANSLIRKICAISQSADAETKTAMLDQIGILSNSLQSQITQLKDDLVDNIQYVNTRIDLINHTLSLLDTRMTDAATAITALQSAVASLTRNKYVLVQTLSDFPAPDGGSVITLLADTDYSVNGSINLGTNQIKFSSGSQLFGINIESDILTYTGTGSMFTNVANAGFNMWGLHIIASSAAKTLDFTGNSATNIVISGNEFEECANLGSVAGGQEFSFENNEIESSTDAIGLSVSGTFTCVDFVENEFTLTKIGGSFNAGLTILTGTIDMADITHNELQAPNSTTITLFDIRNVVVVTVLGTFANNKSSLGSNLFSSAATQVNSTSSRWWFSDNAGLANSGWLGTMRITSPVSQTTGVGTWNRVAGATYITPYSERFTFVSSGIGAITPLSPTGSGYVGGDVGKTLTVVDGLASLGTVKILAISGGGGGRPIMGATGAPAGGTWTAPDTVGTGYTTGSKSFTCSPACTGTGGTIVITGLTGVLTYTGINTRYFLITATADVRSPSDASTKDIRIAIYKNDVQIATSIAGVQLASSTSAEGTAESTSIVQLSTNDRVELWTMNNTSVLPYQINSLLVTVQNLQ